MQLSKCKSSEKLAIDEFYKEICRDEEMLAQSTANEIMAGGKERASEGQDVMGEQRALSASSKQASASLMKNVFGNYVIQLIFQRGNPERVEQFY